jgi:hypothetical protein
MTPSQRRCLLVVSALTLVLGARAQAQIGKRVWASIGVGIATAHLSCTSASCPLPDDDLASGTTVTPIVQLGLILGKHFRVGGELSFWQRQRFSVTTQLGTVSFGVSYHPLRSPNLFIRGGVGRASLKSVFGSGNYAPVTSAGLASLLGVGYEVAVTHEISFVSMATYHHGVLSGDSSDLGFGHTEWRESLWIVGAAIRVHG